MLRPYESFYEKPRRRIAEVPAGIGEVAGWLGLPDGVIPVSLRAGDDGQCLVMTVVGDSLDEVVWDAQPPLLRIDRTVVRQSFDAGDGGPPFERVAVPGSPEADAMDGLTPERLLAAVRAQVEVSA